VSVGYVVGERKRKGATKAWGAISQKGIEPADGVTVEKPVEEREDEGTNCEWTPGGLHPSKHCEGTRAFKSVAKT